MGAHAVGVRSPPASISANQPARDHRSWLLQPPQAGEALPPSRPMHCWSAPTSSEKCSTRSMPSFGRYAASPALTRPPTPARCEWRSKRSHEQIWHERPTDGRPPRRRTVDRACRHGRSITMANTRFPSRLGRWAHERHGRLAPARRAAGVRVHRERIRVGDRDPFRRRVGCSAGARAGRGQPCRQGGIFGAR